MKETNKDKIEFCLLTFVVIYVLGMMVFRIHLYADINDEIVNLAIAYRMAMGQTPIVDMWEAFQCSGVYLSVFLRVFLAFTSNTEGVVLFSRYVYLANLILLALIAYDVIAFIDKKVAILMSAIILCFNLYSLYYLWYDSESVIFMSMALLLILKYWLAGKSYNLYIAGFLMGLMALSYPQLLVIAIAIVIYSSILLEKKNGTNIFQEGKWQVFGGFSVFILVMAYIGIKSRFAGFLTGLEEMLFSRTGGDGKKIQVMDIFHSFYNINKVGVVLSIVVIFLYLYCRKHRKAVPYLCYSVIVVSMINQVMLKENYRNLQNIFTFLGLYAPIICSLLDNEQMRKGLSILWGSSYLSIFIIAFSSVSLDDGPIKSWQAFLPAAIAMFISIAILLNHEFTSKEVFRRINEILMIGIIVLLINSNYTNYYSNSDLEDNVCEMKTGIYKGVYVSKEMQVWEDIEKYIKQKNGVEETVMVGVRLTPIYLMSQNRAVSPTVTTINMDRIERYIQLKEEYPSNLFIEPFELKDDRFKNFVDNNYVFEDEQSFGQFSILHYKYSREG